MMLWFALALSAMLSSLFIPIVISFCHKHRLYDRINDRKVHKDSRMPRLGGVAIAFSFVSSILFLQLLQKDDFMRMNGGYSLWPIITGGLIVFLTGLLDDLYDLRAMTKLALQSLAALIVIASGYRFKFMIIPFGAGILDFGNVSYFLTFFWLVGITNAINLIDGIDGLAGGISALAALAFGLFFMFSSSLLPAEICLALVGSLIGFLIFNLPPAKIFMGDSGSLFLGYILAVIPLMSQYKGFQGEDIGVFSAATVLSIPIFDTLMAIFRRLRSRKSLFSSDCEHLHHKLLARGYQTPQILAILYLLTIVLGMVALSTLFIDSSWSFILNICMLGALFVYFVRINLEHRRTEAKP